MDAHTINAVDAAGRAVMSEEKKYVSDESKSAPDWFLKCIEPAQASAAPEQEAVEIDWPEFSEQGMGCGLEDRGITDRYEAMRYGYEEALDQAARVIEGMGPLYTHADPLDVKILTAQRDSAAEGRALFASECARLRAELSAAHSLSVTNILLDVVPGDGDGEEIHANSVADVNQAFGKMVDREELLRAALQHIIKTVGQSRSSTRRLRWIEQRAAWALAGREYDNSQFDLPRSAGNTAEKISQKNGELKRELAKARELLRYSNDVMGSPLNEEIDAHMVVVEAFLSATAQPAEVKS